MDEAFDCMEVRVMQLDTLLLPPGIQEQAFPGGIDDSGISVKDRFYRPAGVRRSVAGLLSTVGRARRSSR